MKEQEQLLKRIVVVTQQVADAFRDKDEARLDQLRNELIQLETELKEFNKGQEGTMTEEKTQKDRISEVVCGAVGMGLNRTGKAVKKGVEVSRLFTKTVVVPAAESVYTEAKTQAKLGYKRFLEELKK